MSNEVRRALAPPANLIPNSFRSPWRTGYHCRDELGFVACRAAQAWTHASRTPAHFHLLWLSPRPGPSRRRLEHALSVENSSVCGQIALVSSSALRQRAGRALAIMDAASGAETSCSWGG